jgi:hypothetical protein
VLEPYCPLELCALLEGLELVDRWELADGLELVELADGLELCELDP